MRRAYDLLAEGFGPGTNGPLIIAVEGDAVSDQQQFEGFVQAVQGTENVNIVVPTPINDQLGAARSCTPTVRRRTRRRPTGEDICATTWSRHRVSTPTSAV